MNRGFARGGDERCLGRHDNPACEIADPRLQQATHHLSKNADTRQRRFPQGSPGTAMTNQTPSAHAWTPRRFMVIVGHPDDADFGPAGTVAAWIDAGAEGWLVCCTSGDAGGEDPNLDPLELARAREEEQRRAAEVVGYAGVTFLLQPDGSLVNDLPLREMLVREIRTFRPDAVLCGDPEVVFHGGGGINHTDHRAAAMAAVDAVYPAARNPMTFPWLAKGGLPAHKVRRLYLMWSNQADI